MPPLTSLSPTSPPQNAPSVPWQDFLAFYFDWEQGEHVTLVGPTGGGKTTLALEILPLRDYVLAIATKQRDSVLYSLEQRGYESVEHFDLPADVARNVVLVAPLPKGADSLPRQRAVIKETLRNIYVQGGWTVYLDECRYLTGKLRLADDVELLWQQGRSSYISVVAAVQRPAFVPLAAYDQATHLFFWRDNDKRNLDRIGGLGAHDSAAIADEVARLPRHEILYVNTRTGAKVRTKVDL